MRGESDRQKAMVVLMDPETLIPKDHPLREIKKLMDGVFKELSPVFDRMYSRIGRASIPPERLLGATILMALYSIRSERMFCEQLSYNLLFRWFLDMDMVEPAFDHSTFSANRERLMEHEVSSRFFQAVVSQAKSRHLMSAEHFTVDGSMIEAWASIKSFKRKDGKDKDQQPPDDPGNPTVDYHGEKRSNTTHESKTDPECRLYRKSQGKEAKLSYLGHALMENRNGLMVDFRIDQAHGFSERFNAIDMVDDNLPGDGRITLGADKHYDSSDFVEACRDRNVTLHVAQNITKRRDSAIDGRTTRHEGYAVSQKKRKRVEEIFGWLKTVAGFRKTRYKGKRKTQFWAYLVGAAYNMLRITKLAKTTA